MPPPSPAQQMMFPRPNRPASTTQTSAQANPLLNYPNVSKPTQSQQPQTPPIPQQVPLSPYTNQPQNQNYNYIQQQRLQQVNLIVFSNKSFLVTISDSLAVHVRTIKSTNDCNGNVDWKSVRRSV